MFCFVVINYLSRTMVVYFQNDLPRQMWHLCNFLRSISCFSNILETMHLWKNMYDIYMKIRRIRSMWPKVYRRYIIHADPHDRLGYAITLLQQFVEAMPQCIDYIRQGLWVFFNEQWSRRLFFQSCMMMALVVTRTISDSVFRTLFLHRIWYCS
jgi:hypothetical protein